VAEPKASAVICAAVIFLTHDAARIGPGLGCWTKPACGEWRRRPPNPAPFLSREGVPQPSASFAADAADRVAKAAAQNTSKIQTVAVLRFQ